MELTYPSSIATNIAQPVNEYKSIQWLISVLDKGIDVNISQAGKAGSTRPLSLEHRASDPNIPEALCDVGYCTVGVGRY
jgi:hypothetical protein